jgi:hypothetical protein
MNHLNRGLFTSASQHWETPQDLYQDLDLEFGFNDDPCPLNSMTDGLSRSWGTSTYCNPPYGKETGKWLRKAYEESLTGKTIVCLVASRTDVPWFHDYAMKASEIRFIRGRLHFNGSKINAPFPSAIVIFKALPGIQKEEGK